MKVSRKWLQELVELKVSTDKLIELFPHKTMGTKEITPEFFELDMKGYNRADLLSLRGVAYEASAITDSTLKFAEFQDYIWSNQNLPQTPIAVEGDDLCSVYCVAKIEGLKVESSPVERLEKLKSSGMRPVNNLADVTNLVMLEYGQPLHAFDAQHVAQETLVVRRAKTNEKLKTLDDKERTLSTSDIVIADPQKILGLAGVMGGKQSEVTEQTQTILLEAAIFNGKTLRRTAQRLNLHSEAGKRFQHGLTPTRLLQALNAAVKMYQQLGGKLTAINLYGNFEVSKPAIIVRIPKVQQLSGILLSKSQIVEILRKLHCEIQEVDTQTLEITPPYFRLDVELEEDIIEEVARIYGYSQIKLQELSDNLPEPVDQHQFTHIHDLKQTLVELGLTEVQTYSFISSNLVNTLPYPTQPLVKILNPISSETTYLRNAIWPNLVEVSVQNLKQFEDVAIFEIGKTFSIIQGQLPIETYKLTIALSNGSDNPTEELHSIVIKAMEKTTRGLKLTSSGNSSWFHPTRQLLVTGGEGREGILAEVHPRIVNKLGSDKRVAVFEISLF